LGDVLTGVTVALGEVTAVVPAAHLSATMRALRDRPELRFEMLIDACGVDYSTYGDGAWTGARFAVVYHLLSLSHNHRLRVRTFADDDGFPILPSVVDTWPAANWFEREAFDLYGIGSTGTRTCGACYRLRLRRASVPQGFSAVRSRRDALRPRTEARDLPARVDRAARNHAADHPRKLRRNEVDAWPRFATTR
jgi:hypothetical protein